MKRNLIAIFLILTVLECCSQNKKQTSTINSDTIPLLKYKGNWVHHTKSGFILIDMNELQHITIYEYLNRENDIGETDPNLKHWFYKSKGFVKGYHEKGFSIQTDKFRYDLILQNDTLFIWNELGLDEAFIKLESSKE